MEEDNLIIPINEILPNEVIIIPLKFRPVFPGMITPLVISTGSFSKILKKRLEKDSFLGLVLQKNDNGKELDPDNLYNVGTLVKVIKKMVLSDGSLNLLVNSLNRFEIESLKSSKSIIQAKIINFKEPVPKKTKEIQAYTREILLLAKEMSGQNPFFTEEMKLTLINVDEPSKVADYITSILSLDTHQFQEVLEAFDLKERLNKALFYMSQEMELIKIQKKIQDKVNNKIEQQQREFLLKEQLRLIKDELNTDRPGQENEIEKYLEKLDKLTVPEETKDKIITEIEKLEYIEVSSSEYSVIRSYLDTVFDLPWGDPPYEEIDLIHARKILDKEHYKLDDVKERILEHLAIQKFKKKNVGSIICLVGPPGVGKTSLGKSLAKAINREFYRFSLGGMRDEAEIKGHRRTYIGAMPGKIIQALKNCKSRNPIILLDEVDKLGMSYQGDPASALLEVLDPAQNNTFRDNYIDLPFDLSMITFILTANTLDTIPPALLDRMEIIELSGYILEEKIQIAKKYLYPRTLTDFSLKSIKGLPKLSNKSLRFIIDKYCREAGVRSLEKSIRKIYRKISLQIALATKPKITGELSEAHIQKFLGLPIFDNDEKSKNQEVGTALGLAFTSMGGTTLVIEAKKVIGKGRLKVTGQLGDVMKESIDIAFTYVRSIYENKEFWETYDFHIHVPDGATPKDGPSAGITIASSLLSVCLNKKIRNGFAMTGELTLTGKVFPIGGLKEKTIAAKRIGIKKIIFPQQNLRNWEELPESIRKGIAHFPVEHFHQVREILF